jgi:hypothetical protein
MNEPIGNARCHRHTASVSYSASRSILQYVEINTNVSSVVPRMTYGCYFIRLYCGDI